jgi:hypothetical protein
LGIILMFWVLRGAASHRVPTSEITDVPAFARSCVPGCGLLNHETGFSSVLPAGTTHVAIHI